jgi:hypothetical protein
MSKNGFWGTCEPESMSIPTKLVEMLKTVSYITDDNKSAFIKRALRREIALQLAEHDDFWEQIYQWIITKSK